MCQDSGIIRLPVMVFPDIDTISIECRLPPSAFAYYTYSLASEVHDIPKDLWILWGDLNENKIGAF